VTSLPSTLDKRRVAAHFDRAAVSYDDHDALQREVAARLLEQLDYVTLVPERILDLGSGTGRVARALATRYRRAAVYQCDLAPAMLLRARTQERRWFSRQHFTCADVEALPYASGCFDLACSNLALQWTLDLGGALGELRRVVRQDGLVLFSTLGPDTLQELRAAWAAVSPAPHVNRFLDMHDVGDALVNAGFADPVLSTEHITVEYDDLRTLMQDLKGIGAANADSGRSRGLTGRQSLAALEAAYERFRRNGTLPATYEVVFAHAWAAGDRVRAGDGDGIHTFPLARLRRR